MMVRLTRRIGIMGLGGILAVAGGPAPAGNLSWANTSTGLWDVGTTANWLGDAPVFADGDNVSFTNAAGGAVRIASAGVRPGDMTVSGSGTYAFSNELASSAALINAGAGTFTKTGSGKAVFPAYTAIPSLGFTNVVIAGGTLQYGGSLLLTSTTNGLGTGPVWIDNGASLYIVAYKDSFPRLTNDITILPGGGKLDVSQAVGGWNPGVVFPGALSLQGDLRLVTGGANNQVAVDYRGAITLVGGNRAIGSTAAPCTFLVSGNIANDTPATPRRLMVNRDSGNGILLFSGDNTGLTGGITVSNGSGIVRFASRKALGGGGAGSVLISNAYVATSYATTNDADMGALLALLSPQSAGVLGFDNSGTYAGAVDMSALPGLRLGSSLVGSSATGNNSPLYSRIRDAITPAGSTYLLGGGGGALVLNTNALTGAARALDVSIPPGQAAGGANQIGLAGSQSYGGGTLVNTGAVLATWTAGGTPFGTGPVIVYGTLAAASTRGSFVGVDTSRIVLMPGATLALADDGFQTAQNGGGSTGLATGRWDDTTPITLTSGTFAYRRNWGVPSVVETNGALTVSGGSSLSFPTSHNGPMNTVVFASLTRTNRGVLTVRDYTMASTVVLGGTNAASPGDQQVYFAAGAAASNGFLTINGAPAPWLVDAARSTFLTYDVTGLTNVAYTVSAAPGLNTPPAATDLVDQTNNIALNNNPTVYALRSSGAISNGVVTLVSGGLILTGARTHTATFAFGTTEALIYAAANNTLAGNLVARGGLTTFGPGTLTLSAAGSNTIAGDVYVQGGTLAMGSTNAAQQMSNNVLTVNYGATFNTGAFAVPLAALRGQGTLQLANTNLSRVVVGTGTGLVGAVTLDGSSAYIAPGDGGVGTLTLAGMHTNSGLRLRGGELRIDLQSAQLCDLLSVGAGAVVLGDPDTGTGGSKLVVTLGYEPAAGDLARIVDVAGSTPVTGRFGNGDSVAVVTAKGTYHFDILYNSALAGGDGNDIVLRAAGKTAPGLLLSVQ